ncbi:hypothetical protein HPB48_023121 [Haemaphysalis longicornis]|uniref:HAT C-terminal dimerisation domain-containing protein n=1 Tax=Haemaphysalis longicornis TaxID=44386 RepID=A0A9J6H271_HAELO|nr:hypothetical protein HPB48_023121 [Haemaphysalis longicornis]
MPKLRPTRASVLCDQLLYLDLSWTDLEDLFLGYRDPKPRQSKSSGGLLDVNSFDEEEFRRMFRFANSQGVKVSGQEALLMGLRRLAYPNRWWDLERMFGRHLSSMSSVVSILFNHVETTFGHLLEDLNSHQWLTVDDLPELAEAFHTFGPKAGQTTFPKQGAGRENMGIDPLEVMQDVPTRWNSEHAMMSRLLELRTAISAELSESDSVENLSSAEWKLMAGLVSVLEPIQQATTELSAATYPTLSQVIPLLECTEITLKEYISQANVAASFAGSLLRSLKTRFVDVKICPLLVLAVLVDPRYKAIFHSAPSEKVWASSLMLSEVEKLHPTGTAEATENETATSTTEEACSVWAAFSKVKMASEERRQSVGMSQHQKQVNEYLQTELLGR